ncbi:pre-rRNA-processing protein ESF2-like isoform X1 [Papaver somniferum]|uniref:pre-rRNA-processing protein ESF2-like isoform X1 n=2 Tax=Papaver somniferum TaxID=3469 RepID=UPI000E6F785C|nr:pre-rRNA-processing protein ESF2-like isoform X1 [Papaver somniferum]
MYDEEQPDESDDSLPGLGNADDVIIPNDEKQKKKRKKILLEEAKKARNRGVCYLSRIPPQMDPVKLRQVLSQHGEIDRIYLVPETKQQLPQQVNRKKAGDFRGQGYEEGWVEFTNKRVAKRVAHMLNGEQMGGRKKSSFFYDIWNIKYLSKFKWEDLTEEIAYKHALQQQKLVMVNSAAKKEKEIYMDKVDKSNGLNAIEERRKKKQKIQEQGSAEQQEPKVIRHFRQTRPVKDDSAQPKSQMSRNVLAGLFCGK